MLNETRITQHKKTAYVWVFATFREVGLPLFGHARRESGPERPGWLQGVLVSDFYAAYDSMPCPQQSACFT